MLLSFSGDVLVTPAERGLNSILLILGQLFVAKAGHNCSRHEQNRQELTDETGLCRRDLADILAQHRGDKALGQHWVLTKLC